MLIAFHKPYGVLCQFTPDLPGQITLANFDFPRNIYPLGRLDMDSEGLLLLSDEPSINDRLLNPKNAHARTYQVQVEGIPTSSALERLRSGTIFLSSHHCLPCQAEILDPQPTILPRIPPIRLRKTIPDCWLEITLTEGKNRQVRRMTAAIGHPTLRLIRTSIGNLQNPCHSPGEWKILHKTERAQIGI